MHLVLIVARLIHVVTGAYWFGAVLFVSLFVGPSVMTTGPAGAGVMRELLRRRYIDVIIGMASLTILSGAYLVWVDSAHFDPAWFRAPFGQGISTGMAAAVIAYLIGVFGVRPTVYRLAQLGGQIAQAPSPPLMAELDAGRKRLMRLSGMTLVLLLVAASAMAVARYL